MDTFRPVMFTKRLSHPSPFGVKTLNAALQRSITPLPALLSPFQKDTVTFGKSDEPDEEIVNAQMTLPKSVWDRFMADARRAQMSPGDYFTFIHPQYSVDRPKKPIVKSVTDTVIGFHRGRPIQTNVTTLMGAEQIFDKWIDFLEKTTDYAQISMYDFQNVVVPGGRGVDGANSSPGWHKQQQILPLIVKKAREGVRFQILLDNSVVNIRDEFNNPIIPRPINNSPMIDYLKRLKEEEGLPIEVVAFPRKLARIYHVKMLVSDGKRAIVGGMNLSNHSPANWDACVAIEGPEVANLQKETFYPDWMMAKTWWQSTTPDEVLKTLPAIEPVSDPAIKVLNTFSREYESVGVPGQEAILDYLMDKLNSPDLKSIRSEQFIATHKPILERLTELYHNGVNIQMLHSASVLDQFPTTRKPVFELMNKGELVRFYNEWKETKQKLHAKWTVFNDDEVIIGSANLSAAGIQSNTNPKHVRGNRDMAVVIRSPKIAKAFLRQFKYDWDFSPPQRPSGYGHFEKSDSPPSDFKRLADKIMGMFQ